MSKPFTQRAPAIALFLITLFAFSPGLLNRYIWDDGPHIVDNTHLRTLGGLFEIWSQPFSLPQYYPIYHSVLWAEYRFWGLQPWGYHLVNIVVHAISALLLWRLLKKLNVSFAWFAAALFAVHPVQVETVAWAMEFKTVLSGCFYFLALDMLLPCWELVPGPGLASADARRRYLLGTFLFLCSLLSKSVTASLPAVILLLVWWKRGRIRASEVRKTIPLFLIGMLSGLFTALLEKTRVGADGPEWDIPFSHRVLIAGRALCVYVEKLAWPHPLAFFYPRWTVDSSSILQWLFPGIILAAVAILWSLRNRIGRGWLVAVLFYIGTLFPALGFANVYPMHFSFVADHFQYLATIGFFCLVSSLLAMVHRHLSVRGPLLMTCTIVLGILSVMTFQRTRVFYDDYTLFRDNVRVEPAAWAGHMFFRGACLDRGEFRAGVEQAALTVSLNPNDLEAREALAFVLETAGDAVHANGLTASTHVALNDNPKLLDDLAAAFYIGGDAERARACIQEALALNPQSPQFLADDARFRSRAIP